MGSPYVQQRLAEIAQGSDLPVRRGRSRVRRHLGLSQDPLPDPHWLPPDVPLLSVARLRQLPALSETANVCGVYFLWDEDRLVYVGSSVRVLERVGEHLAKPPARFDAATYMVIGWPWHLAIEQLYLDAYIRTEWQRAQKQLSSYNPTASEIARRLK